MENKKERIDETRRMKRTKKNLWFIKCIFTVNCNNDNHSLRCLLPTFSVDRKQTYTHPWYFLHSSSGKSNEPQNWFQQSFSISLHFTSSHLQNMNVDVNTSSRDRSLSFLLPSLLPILKWNVLLNLRGRKLKEKRRVEAFISPSISLSPLFKWFIKSNTNSYSLSHSEERTQNKPISVRRCTREKRMKCEQKEKKKAKSVFLS